MASGTIKEGYLCKSPPDDKSSVKSWRDRWFVFRLDGGRRFLEYYEDNTKNKIKGSIPIQTGQLQLVLVPAYGRGFDNVFYVHTPQRKYFMSAPSRGELELWVQSLSQNLNVPITVQQPDGTIKRRMTGLHDQVASPVANPQPIVCSLCLFIHQFLFIPVCLPAYLLFFIQFLALQTSSASPQPSTFPPLPPNWEQHFEPSGRPYFINQGMGQFTLNYLSK
jgi:hypothetical protein